MAHSESHGPTRTLDVSRGARVLLPSALALALAACASRGPPASSCSQSAPDRIPPVAEAVDVDAVVRWLREAGLSGSPADGDAPRTAVLSVRRYRDEAEGTTPWVRVVESDFPRTLAEDLAEEVRR